MSREYWEHVVANAIKERQEDLLELAGDLIRIPTENPPGGCRALAEFVQNWLSARGVDAEVLDAGEGRANILARLRGRGGSRHLVLSGHEDVVPVGDPSRWSFDPHAGDVVGGMLRGRGASDMKAGLAGIVFVVALLRQLDVPLDGDLTLACVADEETGGPRGTSWMFERDLFAGATAAVIAEPCERAHPTIGQKGSNRFTITLHGKPGHGSLQPIHGLNSNVLAARAVLALQDLWNMQATTTGAEHELVEASKVYAEEREGYEPGVGRVFDHVTVNIGTLNGGTSENVISEKTTIGVDTRVPLGLTRAAVNARVQELLLAAGLDAEITFQGFLSEPNWTAPTEPIVADLVGVLREIQSPDALGVLQWASSDAREFRAHGVPVLQYGPAELATIHGVDERVHASDVVLAASVYGLTAIRYLGASGGEEA
jgi:succinyl-diaminopimelate desuccinylase